MKKVLVTGGAGYIGSHIVYSLLEKGCDVVVVDDLSNATARGLRLLRMKYNLIEGNSHRLRCYYVNLNEREELNRIIAMHSKVDLVIHCASCKGWHRDDKFHYFNSIEATMNLMYALKDHSKCRKMVYMSTSQVHGELTDDNQYATCKKETEEFLSRYRKSNKEWSISIVRPSNVIGSIELLGEVPKDTISLPTMIAQASVGRTEYDYMMYVYEDRTSADRSPRRDYIPMQSLMTGMNLVIEKIAGDDESSFRTFEVNSGTTTSVLELMEMYYECSKVPIRAEFVGPRIGDSRQPEKLPDCTDLIELGWNPTYSLENSVRDSYIFYKNNPMGYKDEMVMVWNRD